MSETTNRSFWDKAETIARIISAVTIPIVVGIIGSKIQSSIASKAVSQEYVSLAISILTLPEDNVDPNIRDWAVDLVNENSP